MNMTTNSHEQTEQANALHIAIINLPCDPPYKEGTNKIAYRVGHRDARHAAAELAIAASATCAAPDERHEFVAYWRARYQYSPTHAFLDEFGNFCTPEDDPVHMGWEVWQAARADIAGPVMDTGLPELARLLARAAASAEPITLSHQAAGALAHAMTTGAPDELDHGETVLRIQEQLGITRTGWVSPDVILLRIWQLQNKGGA
jgi:hypothetical protein